MSMQPAAERRRLGQQQHERACVDIGRGSKKKYAGAPKEMPLTSPVNRRKDGMPWKMFMIN